MVCPEFPFFFRFFFLEVWEVQADRITYASAMLACEEAAAWQCSFTLLSMMYEAAIPGLVDFSSRKWLVKNLPTPSLTWT